MGLEAKCEARIGGRWQPVSALLEEKEIVCRGPVRLRAPLDQLKNIRADKGVLSFSHGGEDVALRLGDQATRWATRIANPPSRLDKLGVKAGLRVVTIGLTDDAAFCDEARSRGAVVMTRGTADLVFFQITAARELSRLAALARSIAPAGAIWVLWPKGGKDLREGHVRDAALALGLVDVKVVSFSEVLSGLKLVIRKALRPAARKAASPAVGARARKKEA